MNGRVVALALTLLGVASVRAQLSVEVTLEQEQFLPGEAIPVAVKIRNRSGQTLRLGTEPDWLTFSVESRDGFVVMKLGDPPVEGEFTLGSSQVATKRVDLAPWFALNRSGRYAITASVRVPEWNRDVTSAPRTLDIVSGAKLWSQEFGVPLPPGASNQPPEVRRYTLLQANDPRKQLRLFLRLSDASDTRLLKVLPIGPLVGFSQPETQLDARSRLHLLYQNGPRSFSYTCISPDGEILERRAYEYLGSRPRLRVSEDGAVNVVGGVRRERPDDLPPKPVDDAAPSAAADHGATSKN
ncbi:MAG: hypothetical protein RMK20_07225 [Verrucomicrobiales bacterium]|nr:hypothetical protein [Verrucomicrobiales bacterium]